MRRFTFFFFNDTATTEIYTLSLHDALPIYHRAHKGVQDDEDGELREVLPQSEPQLGHPPERLRRRFSAKRSEEHTSELQSRLHLVCRLLLEKKKTAVGMRRMTFSI